MKNKLTPEKRGDYDRSHCKDAFIVRDSENVRAAVFLDESKTHVSFAVDTVRGGVLCYSIEFEEFVSMLRRGPKDWGCENNEGKP